MTDKRDSRSHENASQSAAATVNCPECGRLPFGKADGPNPTTRYLCAYCNEGAVLREEGVVVDRFSNVCHEDCLEKAVRSAA